MVGPHEQPHGAFTRAREGDPADPLHVRQWQSPADMEGKKPADNGALPDDRRFGAEFFNRSVHITARRDFCRPRESEKPEGISAPEKDEDQAPTEGEQ